MDIGAPGYEFNKPRNDLLPKHRTPLYRLKQCTLVGSVTGLFASTVLCFWHDTPTILPTDTSLLVLKKTGKIVLKTTAAFSLLSLAYQTSVEIVRLALDKPSPLGPILGGLVAGAGAGLMSIINGGILGILAASVGHVGFLPPILLRLREREYEKFDATEKYRYLKNLETAQARESRRLAEIQALEEFNG